jgi:glycerol-3-phosphate dehydrogenase
VIEPFDDDAHCNLSLDVNSAAVANYVSVEKLDKEGNKVVGATVKDELTGEVFSIRAKTIISAVFVTNSLSLSHSLIIC